MDQNNIVDGLRVLVINIAACDTLLVVCGKTYFQRLWCMVEMFMMFTFFEEEEALSRIELVPIETDGVTRESILESMIHFRLEDTHCYDPNEERKLRMVMAEVGEDKFVARIHTLGHKIRARDEAIEAEREGVGRPVVMRLFGLPSFSFPTPGRSWGSIAHPSHDQQAAALRDALNQVTPSRSASSSSIGVTVTETPSTTTVVVANSGSLDGPGRALPRWNSDDIRHLS